MTAERELGVTRLLDWHQRRRGQGVATVSMLVGPAGVAERAWRKWAAHAGRSVVPTRTTDLREIGRAWLRAADGAADLTALARGWLADRGAALPDRFTRNDLDRARDNAVLGGNPAATDAAYAILAANTGSSINSDPGVDRPIPIDDSSVPVDRLLAGVVGLSAAFPWPAVLITGTGRDPTDDPLARLEPLATGCTAIPIGLIVEPDVYADWVGRTAGRRTGVLLHEGTVEIDLVSPSALEARLTAAGVTPPPSAATLARLTADGLAPDVADAYVDAVRRVRAADPADIADDFRSVHERFLFEQLEAIPATAGLFRPNRPLSFDHGNRAAVADLLADARKIVVEVDGRHYHLTEDQYRRDRRKDWLYQRHGYLVLRFLAEDVVEDLDLIVATILEAIEHRRTT